MQRDSQTDTSQKMLKAKGKEKILKAAKKTQNHYTLRKLNKIKSLLLIKNNRAQKAMEEHTRKSWEKSLVRKIQSMKSCISSKTMFIRSRKI